MVSEGDPKRPKPLTIRRVYGGCGSAINKLLSDLGGYFAIPVVHAQLCEPQTTCFDHYMVIEGNECPPRFASAFISRQLADIHYSDGWLYNENVDCPLCGSSYVCEEQQCTNNS